MRLAPRISSATDPFVCILLASASNVNALTLQRTHEQHSAKRFSTSALSRYFLLSRTHTLDEKLLNSGTEFMRHLLLVLPFVTNNLDLKT